MAERGLRGRSFISCFAIGLGGVKLALWSGRAENGRVRRSIARIALFGVLVVPAWSVPPTGRTSTHKREALPSQEARVDINRASIEELLKIPGMTRTWADRVVKFRPYRRRQDLMDQGVVPPALYKKIKGYLLTHRDEE